jgi:iron complex transport system permease protein
MRRSIPLVLILTAAAAVVFVLSVASGRYHIPLTDILAVLFGRSAGSPRIAAIIRNVRLPRSAAALLAGMGLSGSGAAYQSLFRNPLASPDMLGAVAGASFGAALGFLFNQGDVVVQLFAFCGGIAAVGLTAALSRVMDRNQGGIIMLLLSGMVTGAFFSALVSLVKYFADLDNQLPAITFWLMGGLAGVRPSSVIAAGIVILASVAALSFRRWNLNILSLDDDESQSLGLSPRRERGIIIVLSTLMCSASVTLCGPVGWVGLLVPHAARIIAGSNYRVLLPVVLLSGGIYLLLMDDLARNAASVEIPLGLLTAMMGAPVFILLLFQGNYFRD